MYRTPAPPRDDRSRDARDTCDARDGDLLVVLAIVWLGCLAHFIACVTRGGTMDAGATVTAGLVVGLPWLVRRTLLDRIRKA